MFNFYGGDAEINTGEHSVRVLKRSIFSSFQKQLSREAVLFSTLIVMLFQILFQHAHGTGHLVTAPTQYGQLSLSLGQNYLGYIKMEGIQPKLHLVGEWLSVAFGTYSCHFHSFSALLTDLSSWKELKNNFSADANNPNKLFYKYTTNSNTLGG